MRVIIGLHNIESVKYHLLCYWLQEYANKWIIKNNILDKNKIICIFNTNTQLTISKCILSLLKYCFPCKESKCIKISNFKSNIFINKKINTDQEFKKYLKSYFFQDITDFNNTPSDIFDNIKLKYYTKETLLSQLQEEEKKEEKIIDEKNSKNTEDKVFKCDFCDKTFKSLYNCDRHKKFNCKEILNNLLLDDIKTIKSKFNDISEIKQIIHNLQTPNTIVNNNNNNNTINIQVNNVSKQKKLNQLLHNVIDIDTFTENYKNDPDLFLSKDESQVLLENSEINGIDGYCEGLSTYLKKKYCLQLEKITGEIKKYHECVLPYISNDYNLRSHYEKTNNGWILVKSTDKIMKLLNISDQQIYNHHNKFVHYPKKGKKKAINILLRKSDYLDIEQMIKNEENKISIVKSKSKISNNCN
jgi:hypothetical protein